MSVIRRRPLGRGTGLGLVAALSALLAACSGSSGSSVTGPVGTSVGVALSSSNNSAILQQGAQLIFTATVSADPTNAGVTWTLAGNGTLTNMTKTSVTFTAPTGITGTYSPILTATSIADKTKNATALLVVLGTPVIESADLFPANVGSPYSAQVNVAGGLAPFVWSVSSGALPAGLTLGASTTSFSTISGTPTTLGTYSFQITVTDTNKKVATVDLTIVVKPTAACLLEGQFASVYTGYVGGGQMAVGATSMNVSTAGTITGFHDFNPGGTTISETVTGTCATRTVNNGTTQLIGAGNSPVFNYGMTTALNNGRVQLINGGSDQSGSGPLERQTPTDFVLAKLAGNFAFGALGAQAGGARTGTIGAITVDGAGHVTAGHADSNDASPLTNAALTGSLTAPDPVTGRGTLTLTTVGGARTMHFAYYIVTADRLFIASTDPAMPISGFMTRQVGPFSNSSLASPGILSLWGAAAAPSQPRTALALGRLSGADPGSGTINLVLDAADQTTITFSQTFNGGIYSVRTTDGRTTMTFTSGVTTRNFVMYLDGAADGYVVEPGSAVGAAGLLEAQSAGPFDVAMPGLFVSGTQFPEDSSPIVLAPAVHFSTGSFLSNYSSGFYSLDGATGRGVGTINTSGSVASALSFYIVRPDKVVTLQMGTLYSNAIMSWMTSD